MSARHDGALTLDRLSVVLAARLLHWRATPSRFLTGQRGWMPRWKFQPTKKLVDAIRLLEAAKPAHYAMESVGGGKFRVQVEIGGKTGKACDTSKPRAITYAIARALGLDVPDEAPSSLATKPLRGQQGQTR